MPIDMDTADLAGDAFFDLRSKVLPIECSANRTGGWHGDCDNGEDLPDEHACLLCERRGPRLNRFRLARQIFIAKLYAC